MAPRVDNLRESTHRVVRLVALGHLADAAAARDRLAADADSEALHDFRVALRRLRSWERAFRPYTRDDLPGKLRRRLRDLARDTGASRDLEVHLAWLADQRTSMRRRERAGLRWLLASLEQRKADADVRLARDVDARFGKLRRKLERALVSYREELQLGDGGRAAPPAPFAEALAPRVRDAARELQDHLSRVHSPADERQAHEARIAAKRTRYLVEPVSKLVPEAAELVERLKSLQDVLGDLHDAQVFGAEIDALAADAGVSTRRAPPTGGVPASESAGVPADSASPPSSAVADEPSTAAAHSEQSVAVTDAAPWPPREAARPDGGRRTAPEIRPGLAAVGARLRARADAAFTQLSGEWLGDRATEFCRDVEALAAHIAEASAAGIEIERKYLLRYLPEEARDGQRADIEQGYVPGELLRERVRRVVVRRDAAQKDVHYFRTVKVGTSVVRTEIEEETTAEIFDALWPLTRGHRLRKRRYAVESNGRTWEIDDFRDRDLVLAEIELESECEPVEFPAWLAPAVEREVTGEDEYQNINLAR